MDQLQESFVDPLSNLIWSYLLIYLLLGVGVWFTLASRFVQVRLFGDMLRVIWGSRAGAEGGISSFQAFAVGIASRVGTGNIAGVAIALTLGGPGAIFWMWVVAAVGMATGFVEATLAQMYKVPSPDGSYRGGPAYYIERGLGSRAGGVVFAVLLILTFGFVFNMVQANTISSVLDAGHGVDVRISAIVLALLTAPVVLGGVRRIARVAEMILPLFALGYVVLAAVIVVLNLGEVPRVFEDILRGAFGLDEALAGTGGGLVAAMLNGAKRGLFSNEAGMGSAPNAAATATVRHPVQQGLIQSLGVFVDTMVIGSATAFMVLVAGPSVYTPGVTGEAEGAALTQVAVAAALGDWTTTLMTVIVFLFAFSSVLGNYSYAEVNLDFLRARPSALLTFRLLVVGAVALGAVVALELVWALADVAMGLMAMVNLVSILLLGRWALGALRDYTQGRRQDEWPRFRGVDNPHLPGDLDNEVWGPGTAVQGVAGR